MSNPDTERRPARDDAPPPLPELGPRWRSGTVLKRDVFSTIERGALRTGDRAEEAILRRIDQVPWWSRILAKHFLAREGRALDATGPANEGRQCPSLRVPDRRISGIIIPELPRPRPGRRDRRPTPYGGCEPWAAAGVSGLG
ncbi:MAG: hypothetical protein J0H17_10565 [Rhizobiales bacterium]|nr:hypothetical protein [Hyphomicrobiales bacterium]